MYNAQLAYFVDCIRNKTAPKPGGTEGLINMKIVDAAYKSSEIRQVINL
jgi:predicted dehydrogenase